MTIPTSFLYDSRGVELYRRITQHEKYYLYRTEANLMRERAEHIAGALPRGCTVVEIGCGNGHKIAPILSCGGFDYVANDVSATFLEDVESWYHENVREVRVRSWCADAFDASLKWPRARLVNNDGPVALAWLGSSLGNLGNSRAVEAQLRAWLDKLQPDALVLGYDLWTDRMQKKKRILEAYDNDLTAEFIRNGFQNFCQHSGHVYPVDNEYCVRMDDDGRVTMGLIARDSFLPVEESRKFTHSKLARIWRNLGMKETTVCVDAEKQYAVAVIAPDA